MTCVAIIPARGGSRRIPGKNIRDFHGKPIIVYSIDTAMASDVFDRVIVSTDSDEIAKVAKAYGAEIVERPPGLELDEIGTQEVMAVTLRQLGMTEGFACCIYPTAPLMTVEDLKKGCSWARVCENGFVFAVGANPLRDAGMFYFGYTWNWADPGFLRPLVSCYSLMILIPEERCIDINTELDWHKAEQMYAALHPAMTVAFKEQVKSIN